MIEAIELTSTRRSRGADAAGGGPVRGVSFDVYPGQVTALLGAPGSGKSTVLRLMVELEAGGGRTLFGGRPYRALRPAVREVGLALNPDALHPGRTVQAHLGLYAAAGGVPKLRIAEVLEVAGLSTQATVRCGRLDPGQRQRLAIAAALVGDPAALILDEPYALDAHGMSWFHALIRAYAAQGRTVLVAATDPDTLAGTADHVVVLRRGEHDGISRVTASRSAAEVFDERQATVVQVRSPQAARLAAALEAEGARLAPAGPGALQVRGLDRARIGEVAHVAGVCLHELCEIGQDEDLFGLRPVTRQEELLPGVVHTDATWRAGVRLVADEIEEAEVVEAAAEAAENGTALPEILASQGTITEQVKVEQHGDQADTVVEQDMVRARSSAQGSVIVRESASADPPPADQPTVSGSWRTQGSVAGTRWSAVKGSHARQGSVVGTQPSASMTVSSAQGSISSQMPVAEPAPAAASTSISTQPSQTPAASSDQQDTPEQQNTPDLQNTPDQQNTVADKQSAPAVTHLAAAAPSLAPRTLAAVHVAPVAPAPGPPTPAESPEAGSARRRAGALGLRWGRNRPQRHAAPEPPPDEPSVVVLTPVRSNLIEVSASAPAVAQPAAAQPAVPFTVAPPASEQHLDQHFDQYLEQHGERDGMTPWRAVAVRASQQNQNQQQVSLAEAASAEQENST